MTIRNVALVLAAFVLAAASYLGFGRSPDGEPNRDVAAPAGAPLDARPDLDRLIAVFEERATTSIDPLDHRYLGRLYLTRASLTGELPVKGMLVDDVIRKIQEDEPPRPSDVSKYPVPSRLEDLCLRCIRKDPAERVESAADLVRELQEGW